MISCLKHNSFVAKCIFPVVHLSQMLCNIQQKALSINQPLLSLHLQISCSTDKMLLSRVPWVARSFTTCVCYTSSPVCGKTDGRRMKNARTSYSGKSNVNWMRDSNGLSYANKMTTRCDLSVDLHDHGVYHSSSSTWKFLISIAPIVMEIPPFQQI